MAVTLIYETHSLTVDNEVGIATGWLGGVLSDAGREQARRLGERRRDADVVFSSDLERAVETAELAFGGTEIPILFDPRLRECNYGKLNGGPGEAVAREKSRRIETPFPGGESYSDVVERTRSFVADLTARHDGQRVVAIGHSANLWALQHLLEDRSLEELVAAPFEWQEGWEFAVGQ
jgi:broad specificity phosphatase PhoE